MSIQTKRNLINSIVEHYHVSFALAEQFVESFSTKEEFKDIAAPNKEPETLVFENIYGDKDLDKVLARWKDSLSRAIQEGK